MYILIGKLVFCCPHVTLHELYPEEGNLHTVSGLEIFALCVRTWWCHVFKNVVYNQSVFINAILV